jgi:Flp pilus assembly protein TadD
VLVTIALHHSSTALAIRTKSTEALGYFDKILAINPKNVTAPTSKAIALNYLGNHTGAIQYFDKALAIDPKNVRALDDKGISLIYLRNFTRI